MGSTQDNNVGMIAVLGEEEIAVVLQIAQAVVGAAEVEAVPILVNSANFLDSYLAYNLSIMCIGCLTSI